jgi:hypothetical protein
MNHFVKTLALVSSLAAALLAAIYGAWKEMPVVTLVLRSAVSAAVVYAFLRLGGELAGKSILRGLAEHQMRRDEARKESLSEDGASEERKAA